MRTERVRTRTKLLSFLAATAIAAFSVTSALAVHDVGEFELDKDTANDQSTTPLGYLATTANSGATTLNICQILSYTDTTVTPPVTITYDPPVNGDQIIIRNVVLTFQSSANGNFGGSCAGTKKVYTVTPALTAQQKGGNDVGAKVSLIVPDAVDGPDWNDVYAQWSADHATKCTAIGLVECTFIPDGVGPTIFTIGSTKDHLPIEGWHHTSGSSPDKAEILNAYAAKAIDENDDQILYFGMDRQAVDGSTDIGFWFFQDEVVACPSTENPDACEGVPNGQFAGTHVEGDLLALGTFTQGGATSTIRLFKWVDSGGNEQEHIDGPVGTFGDCVPGSSGDNGCATVNNTTIQVPWQYTFKGSSTGGWVPAGGFYEGGINLTASNLEGCFASFLAETRSSPEITAILKDFALGSFESCEATVTTTPSDAVEYPLSGPAPLLDHNKNGVPDIQLGTGAAGADVTDAAVIDVQGTDEWDGTMSFFLCGPIPTTDTCDGSTDHVGVAMGSIGVDETTDQPIFSSIANLTEVGYYCWRGEFDSDTNGVDDTEDASVGECFEVLPVKPTLTTQSVDSAGDPLNGTVPFGQALYDKATLAGTANDPGTDGPGDSEGNFKSINATNGAEADGTITFTLKVDEGDDPDDSCGATVTGDPQTSNPEDVDVDSGDGDYMTTGFTPDVPGVFGWTASYSGSSSNTLGTDHNTDCDQAPEAITVQQVQPSLSTAQTFIPNDAVTVTVEGGAGALDGSVTFQLFVDDASCTSDPPAYEVTVPVSAADGDPTLTATAQTSNTTAYPGSHKFYWKMTFESNNNAHLGIEGACGNENSETIVDDGSIENTPPGP
jgi:hypothetical protein